jgi:hypothetical protein
LAIKARSNASISGVLAQALKDAGYRVVDDEELTQS